MSKIYNKNIGRVYYDYYDLPEVTINIKTLLGNVSESEIALNKDAREVQYINTNSGNDTISFYYEGSLIKTLNIITKSKTSIDITNEKGDIVVDLSENATGKVTLTVNNNTYIISIENSTAVGKYLGYILKGKYNVTASYGGDVNYMPVNLTKEIEFGKVKSDLTIINDENVTVNSNLTVSVVVPKDATGKLNITIYKNDSIFKSEDVTIDSNVVKYVIDNLDEIGEYAIVARYYGDDTYFESDIIMSNFTVIPVDTKKNASIISEVFINGSRVTMTIYFDEDATGNVLLAMNDTIFYGLIVNGEVSIGLIGLDAGIYDVTLTYSGDDTYEPAAIASTLIIPKSEDPTPNPIDPKAEVNVSDNAISIDLPADATGYMLIDVDGLGYYVPVKNGSATFNLPDLAPGFYTVNVAYTGDKKYAPANSTEYIIVPDIGVDSIVSEDLVKVEKAPDRFVANFTDADGEHLANTNVTFEINGGLYTRTTDANGQASIAVNLNAGNYTITITNPVTGDVNTNNITVLPRIIENYNLVKYFRNDSQYVVKVLGDDGNIAPEGEIVTFNINGVFYNRTVNATGHVKLSINLNPGDYIITAEYKGCKVSNNITVLPVLTGTDLVKKFGVSDPFEAKLVDGQGNPFANQKIEFNINGVLYYRTTDSSGIARLNINLQQGEYIITSVYGAAAVSNNVTIIP